MSVLPVVSVWAVMALGFSLVALARLSLRRPRRAGAWVPGSRVLLIRPVDAPTEQERFNLQAPLPEWVDVVVASPARVALPAGASWVRSDPATPNRKVGHLLQALGSVAVGPRVVVCADADVLVDAELLGALASPVADGAALCSAAPRVEQVGSLGAHALAGVLNASHHAFEALDVMRAGAPTVCGKALAFGPAALALLPSMANCLGEDLELAHRLHQMGERVELASAPARLPQPAELTVRTVHARLTRWMVVLRAHRPGLSPSVPLLFAATPLLAVSAAVLQSPWLLTTVGALLVVRTMLALRLGARWWQWLLGELVLLAAFVASLGRRSVLWRGRRLALQPGGRIA